MVQVKLPSLSPKMRLLRSLPHLSALPLEPPHSLLLPLHIKWDMMNQFTRIQ
ncbi:hypothetical protein SORBI_3001G068901 [Sorghum bicolor]|uniref:Uncharacterized protein n=1 Tax=Sorghum bicolor TaxID=4558 RepID=A0A1Z5S4L4_SORBI|nr:hypothetical protein SORBI_3001G068901 [Sorghum bicolor]